MGDKYDDKPNLGSYRTSDEQFPNPRGVKTFAGYGADKADLERGFIKPAMRQNPEYELANYKDRWTQPRVSDEDSNVGMDLPADIEFRMKDRETKGLFMRPRIPTER